jgi:hypothetical protein
MTIVRDAPQEGETATAGEVANGTGQQEAQCKPSKKSVAKGKRRNLARDTDHKSNGAGEPSRNGNGNPPGKATRKPGKKRRRKRLAPASKRPQDSVGETPRSFQSRGKTLDAFTVRGVEWFLEPYIPRSMLSLVVGRPNTGKSSFLAYLISRSTRALYFIGSEEAFEVMTLPRLLANGVRPDQVRILDARDYQLPEAEAAMTREAKEFNADLIVCDNMNSHLGMLKSWNDPGEVRQALEAACRVAEKTGAAFVACRHPGQDGNNLNPDSREFRAVPRSIVHLQYDEGPPERRQISLNKDSLGQGKSQRDFTLEGEKGKPPVFKLGEIPSIQGALLQPMDLHKLKVSKLQSAMELLPLLLADGKKDSGWIFTRLRQEGIHEDTAYDASSKLGVVREREGQGGNFKSYWSLPEKK